MLEVVNDFIQKAEPVGSRSISKIHAEKLSPATIRNVMSDLEDMGYLRQPHSSAGRIPTDQGISILCGSTPQPAKLFGGNGRPNR